MPTYLRKILASARAYAWRLTRAIGRHPAVQWAGLVAGYVAVFAGYVMVLIALFNPAMAVVMARGVLVVFALAGVAVLAVLFGRLVNRRAPGLEAARR